MNRFDLIFTAFLTITNLTVLACVLWPRRRKPDANRLLASVVLDRVHNP